MLLFKPALRKSETLSLLISDGLGSDGLVWLKLPPPTANAGKALAWSRQVVDSLLAKGPHVFKIGITADPLFRFYKESSLHSPSPGYYRGHEKFTGMDVLYAATTWEEAALVEAILIETYRETPGNRNVRPGGEGRVCGHGPFFTYLVFKSAL